MTRLLAQSGVLGGADPALLALAGLVLLAVIAAIVSSVIFMRRRLGRDVRSIVQSVEEMRGGRASRRCEVDQGSDLGLVSDAINRLGYDLQARWAEADAAAERWRALSDAATDTAVLTTDTDGDIRSFSSGATKLFGWEESEVVSRPAAVVFDESSYKDVLPKLARRSLRREGVAAKSRLVRRDGTTFPSEISIRMLADSAGRALGFMMVVRDITDQERLETELRESEARFRGLVEGLGDAVFIIRGGRLVYVNPAAAELCGMAPEELRGRPWRDRIGSADVLVVEETVSAVEQGTAPETRLRCGLIGADGTTLHDVRLKVSPVEFDGHPAALMLVHDETDEQRLVTELERNEARLDAVLEATTDGILVMSEEPRGRIVQLANRAAADLLGVAVDDLLGLDAGRLAHRLSERGEGMRTVVEAMAAGRSDAQVRLTTQDGTDHDVDVHVAALTGRGGDSLGRLVLLRDRTDHRTSERRLQEQAEKLQLSKVELERAYRKLTEVNSALEGRGQDLEKLNHELRRLDEMKSNLLGNVSHELQTPLVSIRGYTEMILKERLGPITEEQRKGLGLSLKNIDRLIAMIDNLLAFARTDSAEAQLELSEFPLRSLIDEAVDLMRDKIAEKSIHTAIELESEIVIEGDRDKLLQVMLNLVSNAVKFNYRGGRVTIAGRIGTGQAAVRVTDSGVGIPREEIGRIFERNYRVEAHAAGKEGSGIGLTIVRDLLRLHGCRIHVESEEGRGATFSFNLPLASDRRGEEAGEDPTPDPPPEPPEPDGGDERPRLRIIRRFNQEG